jgi:hypothetical protein
VIDPFGNILGNMYNPHDLEILGANGTTCPEALSGERD